MAEWFQGVNRWDIHVRLALHAYIRYGKYTHEVSQMGQEVILVM